MEHRSFKQRITCEIITYTFFSGSRIVKDKGTFKYL